jgi:hypothetical protein
MDTLNQDNLVDSKAALCEGLEPLVDKHVEALIEDGGPKSRVTGVELVSGYDGGCPK